MSVDFPILPDAVESLTPTAPRSDADPCLYRVFVYGTLKPGEVNYQPYCANWVVDFQDAIAPGQLFALPMGYPAMTPGNSIVYGVLLSFREPAVLQALDELEDYHPHRTAAENEYERCQIQVFTPHHYPLGWAWVYLMTPEQVQQWGGQPLLSGNWSQDWKTAEVTPPD